MEKAAEASGSRFAYLLGDLVTGRAGARAVHARPPAGRGPGPGRATGPRPRGTARRDGLLPRRAGDDLRDPARRAVPGRHLGGVPGRAARRRDPRRRRAAAPLRGLLDLLSARVGGGRKGHPRDLPRPPVRQGGDVLVRPAGGVPAEHERLLAIQERILQALELPYRVVDIPVGDLGAPAARKFDCEAWIPSQSRYREVTSCSNTTDYQARRLDCRFRPEPDAQPAPRPHAERHRRRGRPRP